MTIYFYVVTESNNDRTLRAKNGSLEQIIAYIDMKDKTVSLRQNAFLDIKESV